MFLKKILFMSLLMLCTTQLWAVPAQRTTRLVEQPDGTILALMMRGDERFHYLVTADGVPVVRHEEAYYYALFGVEGFEASEYLAHDAEERTAEERAFVESLPDIQHTAAEQMRRAVKRRAVTRVAEPEVPTTGEVHVPILLVQYADVKFSSVKSQMEELANGEDGTAEEGTGSIRQFFVDQSEGKFLPTFDVIGPITLKNNMEYYGANDKEGSDLRPQEMAEEASKLAYAEFGVDFKRYDNNHDGYVDFLYIIYAGYGEASYPDMLENTIWPHQWELEAPLMLGGVNVQQYACNNELAGYRGNTLAGIGTFCHEFSHCLGLPDFYDTSSGGDTAFGMNKWSIMDQGCYNNDGHTPCGYNAYEKDFIGWKLLVELKEPMCVTLKPLSEGGEAYKIVNDANPNEFYVVEHVDQKGWCKYAPASGMMVLHVDYLRSAWHNNTVNNDPDHQRVSVIPADGKSTAGTLASDVYPGPTQNRSLTATSNPAAKVYKGGYMHKDITDITSMDGVVTFNFMREALLAPRVHMPVVTSPTDFTLMWDTVEDVEAYDVRLDRLEESGRYTTVYTARVEACNYAFEGLSEGVYRCYVRSVSNGLCSDYAVPVEVELADTQQLEVCDMPRIHIHRDSIVIVAPESEVYYTLDGSYPTVYSARYTAPIVTTEKVTVRAIARREGYRNSLVAQLVNWFSLGDVTYRLVSTEPNSVVVTDAPGGNDDEAYCGHYSFGDRVWCEGKDYALVGFDTGAFAYAMNLRSVEVTTTSLLYVGDSLFHGCSALNAVVWDASVPLPDAAFDEDSYRNLLVYLPDTIETPALLVQTPYVAVIRGGYCEELSLDATSAFYCPRQFTAGRVTYRRTFKQTTVVGVSGGWETLVLPFDVQRITHATKGDITPFGIEGNAHCWLATPQDGAFVEATEIRANMPYIISIPNNEVYGDRSLAGSITFSAEEAEIHATSSPLAAQDETVTVSFALMTTYEPVEASDGVYALNVGAKYGDYVPGSVFVSGRYETPPFSVYLVSMDGEPLAPFYRIAVEEREKEVEEDESALLQGLSVTSREGFLYIVSSMERIVNLYDVVGRLVQVIRCGVGTTMVGPLDEGVYIIDKTKLYVDR